MDRPDLRRQVWGKWYAKAMGHATTAEWLEYLFPEVSAIDRIKYSHAWNTKDCYKPWLEYLAKVLQEASNEALEDYANPEAEICNGGSSPIPFMLELVHRELADRIILSTTRGEYENVSDTIQENFNRGNPEVGHRS